MGKLTIVSARNAKPGRHADGQGLYLLVKPSGSKSWLLRVQVDGCRRDIGLGSYHVFTLTEARERAAELRKAAKLGKDPVIARDQDRRKVPTFKEAAKACHTEMKKGWTDKHAAMFLSSLETHIFPTIGNIRVDQLEALQIRDALAPIWHRIPDMARKVRIRIGMVLNYAHGQGWRPNEAPVRALSLLLSKQPAAGNFAAMPYQEVPAFVAGIRSKSETVGRLALLFLIFTAARSGEVRSARWSHIDLKHRLWHRPAELMKTRVTHTVTLNDAAISILERVELLRGSEDGLVFPNSKGVQMSDMTISKIMRDMKLPYVPHGFRSSFTVSIGAQKGPPIGVEEGPP
ncbi:MAG: integrase arm-type DNA-binding domain-containing protein, partial [Sphingomonadaceae bacterium]|nr:integrase arm-type DNA-binding domain-containing protein [Sphingomonadaceae bacterium]